MQQLRVVQIKAVLARPKPMQMTREDSRVHTATVNCHVCAMLLNGNCLRPLLNHQEIQRTLAHDVYNLKLWLSTTSSSAVAERLCELGDCKGVGHFQAKF